MTQSPSHSIDGLIRSIYSGDSISKIGAAGSYSAKARLVVGMPASGISRRANHRHNRMPTEPEGRTAKFGSFDLGATGIAQGIFSEPDRLKWAKKYLGVLHDLSLMRRESSTSRLKLQFWNNSTRLSQRSRIYMQREIPIDYLPLLLFPAI